MTTLAAVIVAPLSGASTNLCHGEDNTALVREKDKMIPMARSRNEPVKIRAKRIS
jgi:hypothetical protein